jgi:hypothetical protein
MSADALVLKYFITDIAPTQKDFSILLKRRPRFPNIYKWFRNETKILP